MHQAQAVEARSSTRPTVHWYAIATALIILAGCLLRFWHLGTQSLWFDEGYSAWVATLSPSHIVQVIRNDVSPPFYYLLLREWRQWLGDSEAGLRSLSAVASCLTVAVTSAIAWRITRSGMGMLIAAVLSSVSVLQIQYAQEARSYGLASLFAAIALYAAVRRMDGSRLWIALLLTMLVCCVYLHNMMWFYAAGAGLAYLVMPGSVKLPRRLLETSLVGIGLVLAYAWWIPSLLGQIRWLQGSFWATVPSGHDLAQVLLAASGVKMMHLSPIIEGALAGWIVSVALLGTCVGAVIAKRSESARWSLGILAFALLPIVAVYGYSQVSQSYFVEKVFTASSIAVPLLAGVAVAGRWRFPGILLALILLAAGAVSTWGYFYREAKEDWRGAIAYVNSVPREGTLVVFVANEGELLYEYYIRQFGGFAHAVTGAPQGFHELQPERTIQRVLSDSDTQLLATRLEQQRPERIVLVLSHTDFSDPQLRARKLIDRDFRLLSEFHFNLVDVLEYGR